MTAIVIIGVKVIAVVKRGMRPFRSLGVGILFWHDTRADSMLQKVLNSLSRFPSGRVTIAS